MAPILAGFERSYPTLAAAEPDESQHRGRSQGPAMCALNRSARSNFQQSGARWAQRSSMVSSTLGLSKSQARARPVRRGVRRGEARAVRTSPLVFAMVWRGNSCVVWIAWPGPRTWLSKGASHASTLRRRLFVNSGLYNLTGFDLCASERRGQGARRPLQ
jgi:hypothetical protein